MTEALTPENAALVEKARQRPILADIHDLILTNLFGPFDAIGDDMDGRIMAAAEAIADKLMEPSEEAVEAATHAVGAELADQELSGAFDDLGEDGSNRAIASEALRAALTVMMGKTDDR